MKKSYLKNTHELLSIKLCDLVESEIYKPLPPNPKNKLPENVCSAFFENKGLVEFISITRDLRDPGISFKIILKSLQ